MRLRTNLHLYLLNPFFSCFKISIKQSFFLFCLVQYRLERQLSLVPCGPIKQIMMCIFYAINLRPFLDDDNYQSISIQSSFTFQYFIPVIALENAEIEAHLY